MKGEVQKAFNSKDCSISKQAKTVYDKLIRANKSNPKDEEIEECIYNTINYKVVCTRDPLVHLTYVMKEYNKRVSNNKDLISGVENAIKLYNYAKEHSDIKKEYKKSLEKFLTKLAEDPEFKENLLEQYAKEMSGTSPNAVINRILANKKYNFKYRLAFDSSAEKVILKKNNDDIHVNFLSSGERMILSIMSWLFYQQREHFNDNNDSDNKIKILLMDEPDRHLDPDLCKLFFQIVHHELCINHGVQVIMSTHRHETIAFAPEDSIFSVRENQGKLEIAPVSKLEAVFRMTKNIRELTAYHQKVYTESSDDALFYEGMYHSIKEYFVKGCNDLKGSWYPSRRHQLTFHSVSVAEVSNRTTHDKGGGSCKKVLTMISTDSTAIGNLNKEGHQSSLVKTRRWNRVLKLIDNPNLLKSYGILDNDNGNTKTMLKKESSIHPELYQQVEIITRHSLENYVLDPIIFCSALSIKEIESYFDDLKKQNWSKFEIDSLNKILLTPDIYQTIKNLLNSECINVSELQSQINFYMLHLLYLVAQKVIISVDNIRNKTKKDKNAKKIVEKTLETIKKHESINFSNKVWNEINELVEKEVVNSNNSYNGEKEKQTETYKISKKILNDIESYKKIEANKLADTLFKKIPRRPVAFHRSNGDIICLEYPVYFFELRGHTIADKIFGDNTSRQITGDIALKIYHEGAEFIPSDLLTTFKKLDLKLRRNAAQAIKPKAPHKPLSFFYSKPEQSFDSTIISDLKFISKQLNSQISTDEQAGDYQKFGLEAYRADCQVGDCFFVAVASYLPEKNVEQVRRDIVAYIRNNNYLREIIQIQAATLDDHHLLVDNENKPYRSFEEYCKYMSQSGTWATEIEILAAHLVYKRPIVVITPGNAFDRVYNHFNFTNDPIFLYYQNQNHYKPLAAKDAQCSLNSDIESINQKNTESDVPTLNEASHEKKTSANSLIPSPQPSSLLSEGSHERDSSRDGLLCSSLIASKEDQRSFDPDLDTSDEMSHETRLNKSNLYCNFQDHLSAKQNTELNAIKMTAKQIKNMLNCGETDYYTLERVIKSLENREAGNLKKFEISRDGAGEYYNMVIKTVNDVQKAQSDSTSRYTKRMMYG